MSQFITLDTGSLGRDDAYTLLNGAVIPRPIAFVTTVGAPSAAPRVVNGSPYSSLITLTPDPPMLGFIIGGMARSDTLANLQATGEFVINAVSEAMAERIERCAGPFAPHVSEVDAVGFSVIESTRIAPPRIADSPIQFECRLERIVELGNAPDRLVMGRVLCAHVDASILDGLKIDPLAWQPLGRIAGRTFCRIGELLRIP